MEKKEDKKNRPAGRKGKPEEPHREEPILSRTPRTNIPTAIDPEIVAAITALLEIELKLAEYSQPGRFTFRTGEPGWDQFGKSLIGLYQGDGKS